MLYLCVTAECPQLRPAEDIVSGLKGALLLVDSQRSQDVKVQTLLVLLTLRHEASRMRSKPATFPPLSQGNRRLEPVSSQIVTVETSAEVVEFTFGSDGQRF